MLFSRFLFFVFSGIRAVILTYDDVTCITLMYIVAHSAV